MGRHYKDGFIVTAKTARALLEEVFDGDRWLAILERIDEDTYELILVGDGERKVKNNNENDSC